MLRVFVQTSEITPHPLKTRQRNSASGFIAMESHRSSGTGGYVLEHGSGGLLSCLSLSRLPKIGFLTGFGQTMPTISPWKPQSSAYTRKYQQTYLAFIRPLPSRKEASDQGEWEGAGGDDAQQRSPVCN